VNIVVVIAAVGSVLLNHRSWMANVTLGAFGTGKEGKELSVAIDFELDLQFFQVLLFCFYCIIIVLVIGGTLSKIQVILVGVAATDEKLQQSQPTSEIQTVSNDCHRIFSVKYTRKIYIASFNQDIFFRYILYFFTKLKYRWQTSSLLLSFALCCGILLWFAIFVGVFLLRVVRVR